MRLGWVVAAAAAAVVSGCSTVALPPEPTAADAQELRAQSNDAVWGKSGLDDVLRPPTPEADPINQFDAGKAFSGCMEERGWTENYFTEENGYSYRAIQLASRDEERLDWYECFVAHPIDSTFRMRSVEQYDFVYDYYEDVLIPCLRENGYPTSGAPTRFEFRTTWFDRFDPLFPFIWNPYQEIADSQQVPSLPVSRQCPPEPPGQDFYEFH